MKTHRVSLLKRLKKSCDRDHLLCSLIFSRPLSTYFYLKLQLKRGLAISSVPSTCRGLGVCCNARLVCSLSTEEITQGHLFALPLDHDVELLHMPELLEEHEAFLEAVYTLSIRLDEEIPAF